MFLNYLKTSWRNLIRDKSYSVINIIGLAIGVAACLLITLYILDELSYDKFHEKSDRIYRIYVNGRFGDNKFETVFTPNPAKESLKEEFPQVESATHFMKTGPVRVKYSDEVFIEKRFFYADNEFFEVFSFPLIKGDVKNVLKKPNQAVLTEQTARKYFGKQDPMGKMITLHGEELFEVVGICENVPDNSHFHFDLLASYSNSWASDDERWTNAMVYTYFVLTKGVDPEKFEKELNLLVEKYVGPEVKDWMGIDLKEFKKKGNSYGFFIQPMEKIYLHSDYNDEIEPVSDISRIWYFSIIAFFILLIACINFMNLATAKYANRVREVGIRKVVGSGRRQLMGQFLTESVIVALCAVVFALVLVELFLPLFNNLAQKDLDLLYLDHWYVLPALLLLGIIVGLLSGFYPAFFLSSFNPIRILKGKLNKGIKGGRMRGALVVSQFVITIVLFISTWIIYQQNMFMTNKKLGFDKERVVIIDRAYYLGNALNDFIEELKKSPHIHEASVSGSLPGKPYGGSTFQVEGRSSEDMVFMASNFVNEGYLNTMGLELLKGRFFSKQFSSDSSSVVINKKAAGELGFDNPLGKYLQIGDKRYTIVGVIDNHHFESLHKRIRPLVLRYFNNDHYQYMSVKIKTKNLNQSVNHIRETWSEFTNNQPFSYAFLDNEFNNLYQDEQRTAKAFAVFSVLAIFIACLGLLGLSSFMTEKRTKEIGIRKVLGAKIINILNILYKEVFLLLIISTLIAWPVSYYLMNQWLENFAFRIDLRFDPFILSSVAALFIAIITTSIQALKAANTNPSYILHDE
jgi:putative ABC transport system permease protein